jgi:hypothetical protein
MKAYPVKRLAVCLAVAAGLSVGVAAAADEHVAPATEYARATVAKWVADPALVAAVRAQNDAHASLSDADIETLDKSWRAEIDSSQQDMISAVMANQVSAYLASLKDQAGGMVTEIFVMDNRGLNVGQSDVTSDYWQGDEAKWQKTYLAGADQVFVDEVEMDESTQMLQTQVSMSIVDPATNEVIGAITVGIDVAAL